MELYVEKGESRMDCELKIASKYNMPFRILSEKEIRLGGFMGLFTKPGVQVEFYFSQTRQMAHNAAYYPRSAEIQFSQNRYAPASLAAPDLESEKRKLLAAANDARTLSAKEAAAGTSSEASRGGRESAQQILDMLKALDEKVEKASLVKNKNDEHPAFIKTTELLKINDFSQKYIDMILEKMRRELTVDQLDDPDFLQEQLLEWIGNSIGIYKEEETSYKPKVMVLVGPTGVGKTTTLSKLAAIYGIGTENIPAIEVKMITIDAFRICAKEQLEQIGNIMQIPVSCVVNKSDLRKEIALHSEGTDLFLIDTIGKSPKDSAKLGEMKEILDGVPRHSEFHLVVMAGTRTSDIENIMRQFEPFNYKSVIFTKMDETDHIGNIISALYEKRKCVSYITNGQTVPVDIRRASIVRFLINLEGFKINREKIEKRFPSGEADQFKWR